MLDFLYAKVNYTWSASDALLNKIDDYIAHDQVLKNTQSRPTLLRSLRTRSHAAVRQM